MKSSSVRLSWKKRFFSAFILSLVSFFFINLGVTAWSPPVGDPPNNNTSEPIDVSINPSTKTGMLQVGSLKTGIFKFTNNGTLLISNDLQNANKTPAIEISQKSADQYYQVGINANVSGSHGLNVGGTVNSDSGFCINNNCVNSFANTGYWNVGTGGIYYASSTSPNVGIGTTAPTAQLDVVTSLATNSHANNIVKYTNSGTARFEQTSTGLGKWYLNSSAAEVGSIQYSTPGGSPGLIFFRGVGPTYSNNSRVNLIYWSDYFSIGHDSDEAGSNQLYIKKGGNVGVGTTAPAYKLHVAGSVNATQLCINGDCRSNWTATGGESLWSANGADVYRSTGAVGIGTTSPDPAAKLDVNGSIRIIKDGVAMSIGEITNTNRLKAYSSGPTFRFLDSSNSYASFGVGSLSVGSSYAGIAAPSDGAIIAGNVGIGTNYLPEKFNVSGNVYLTASGGQFKAFNEDSVKLKHVNWYISNNDQWGQGQLYHEMWFGGINTSPLRRIGFYLDVPDKGATNAAGGTGAQATNGRMYVDMNGVKIPTGNLGVGTMSPTASLQVSQSTVGQGTVSVSAGGTVWTGVGTQFLNTFKVGDTITSEGQTLTISAISSNTSLTTNAVGAAISAKPYTLVGGPRLSVFGNGNVGIGTANPRAMFEVTSAMILGDVKINGSGSEITLTDVNGVYNKNIRANSFFLAGPMMAVAGTSAGPTWSTFAKDRIYIANNFDYTIAHNSLTANAETKKVIIKGQDAFVTADSYLNGGSVYIYGGSKAEGGFDGNIILGHTGSVSRGNIGIGTTAPTHKLTLSDSSSGPIIALTGLTTSYRGVSVRNVSGGGENWFYGANNSNNFVIRRTVAGGGGDDITIDSAGDVTIAGTLTVDKINVGTNDPPYKINNKIYSTYGASMIGLKEEHSILLTLKKVNDRYEAVIDFKNQKEGSDLWLFAKVSNIYENIDQLNVQLTPSFVGDVWYEKDLKNKKVYIYALPTKKSSALEVSVRLTAPRYDYEKWSNESESDKALHDLDEFYSN